MRALLVDDAQVQRRFVALVLSEFRGLGVDEAPDGLKALELLNKSKYDVVLLDLNLPGADGFKVIAGMRQAGCLNAATPLITVSTQADEETIARCKSLGATKFLSKPVPAVRIRDTVRELLGLPSGDSRGGSEKRRAARLHVPVTVRFDAHDPPLEATTADISPFGAFIQSTTWKPVGTSATLTLNLPHLTEPIVIGCKVVHIRDNAVGPLPQGFGVRFATDKPEDLARLVRAFTTPADDENQT